MACDGNRAPHLIHRLQIHFMDVPAIESRVGDDDRGITSSLTVDSKAADFGFFLTFFRSVR
jgi:hypothetical protein